MDEFLREFEESGKISIHSIDIGITKSARYQTRGKRPDGVTRTPPTVAQVALWNEFGTRGGAAGGGWGGPVPSRPFMRKGMEKAPKDKEIKTEMQDVAGGIDAKKGERLGFHYKRLIQQAVRDRGMAPNAALTIRLKGSSVPLIDQGHMRSSIDFRVNEQKPDDDGNIIGISG
ncbi:MAG: hypothetical protein ISN29_02125 [Gammaproteobacteria bacterium AqS3]|nr:hypothetical protein [Gammaproteobacteria bacterium AqS3]